MSWSYNPFTGTLDKVGGSVSGVELLANKATDLSVRNDTLYPTTAAVGNGISYAANNLIPFYLYSTASDIPTYYVMKEGIPPGGGFGFLISGATDGDLFAAFATEPNIPGLTEIPSGVYKLRILGQQLAGTKTSKIYFDIYKRVLAGTETLLGTSSDSSILTVTNVEQIVDVVFPSPIAFLSTDRIIVKIYARVTGAGTDPDLNLSIQGLTRSRFEYPASILDLANAYADSVGDAGWKLVGNAGTPGTSVQGTTDAQPWTTIVNGIFVDSYNIDGTVGSIQNITQIDGDTKYQRRWQTNLTTSIATTTTNFNIQNNSVSFGGAGFDYAGQIACVANSINHSGAEHVGFMGAHSAGAFFTGGGHTDLVKNNDSNINVNGPYQIDALIGSSSYINASQLTGAANGFESGLGFSNCTLSNTTMFSGNSNVYGTSTSSGTVSAMGINVSAYDTAAINFLTGASFGTSLYGSATASSTQGIQQNMQLSGACVVSSGNIGLNTGVSVRDTASVGYVNGIQNGISFEDTSSATNINAYSVSVNATDSPTFDSVTCYSDSTTINGSAAITNSLTSFGIYSQLTGSSTASNFQCMNLNPQISGSASVTNFQPFQLYANIQNTATVTNSVTLADFNLQSTPALAGCTGLNVNVTGATVSDALTKFAIQSQGGIHSFQYDFTVPSASSAFLGVHNFGANLTIANGDPISSLGFINNYGQSLTAHDHWTADFTGIRIGWVPIASIAQCNIDAGKTIDSFSGVLSGLNNVAGTGTIDQAFSFRAGGVIPGGGGVTTNLEVGFQAMPTMGGTSAGNMWAFRDDTASGENHFGKVAIGTGNKKVSNSDTAFEIGNSKMLLPGQGTTATKNALSALESAVFYDSTVKQLQFYNGTSWVSSGSPNWIPEAPVGAIDGGNQTFVTSQIPITAVAVFFNGIFQLPGVGYTISGDTITTIPFLTPGETIEVHYGAGGQVWIPEAPAGLINGANQTFVTSQVPVTAVMVFFNGTFQLPGIGYTIAGDTITTIPTLTASETIEVYYGY